jgi:hypothetical protein
MSEQDIPLGTSVLSVMGSSIMLGAVHRSHRGKGQTSDLTLSMDMAKSLPSLGLL